MFDENKRIGVALCALGLFLWFLGVIFLFDRAVLATANVSFLAGITMVLGPYKAARFFIMPKKLKGTLVSFVGFVAIIMKWTIIGVILQTTGVWMLFSAFLPQVVSATKASPVGFMLDYPPIRQMADWVYDQRTLPV